MASFSDRLKRLRREYNFSLRQLSALCEISPSALHAYEIGSRNPKREALEAIADVFNCDMAYLEGTSDIRNKAANSIGYNSLADAYYDLHKEMPTPELNESERAWIELYRKLSPDVRETFVTLIETFDNLPDPVRQMLFASMQAAISSQNKKST